MTYAKRRDTDTDTAKSTTHNARRTTLDARRSTLDSRVASAMSTKVRSQARTHARTHTRRGEARRGEARRYQHVGIRGAHAAFHFLAKADGGRLATWYRTPHHTNAHDMTPPPPKQYQQTQSAQSPTRAAYIGPSARHAGLRPSPHASLAASLASERLDSGHTGRWRCQARA